MTARSFARHGLRYAIAGVGAAAAAYAVYIGTTWLDYGQPLPPAPSEADPMLDRFMPHYDVVERHHIAVNAPPAATLMAAGTTSLSDVAIVRAIFKGREVLLRSKPAAPPATPSATTPKQGLLDEMRALGWVVLAEHPGREIVVGAVTKPWEANVTFRSIPPAEFRAFREPGYVKIAWTLRADPDGADGSIFRTETRAVATDEAARERFRIYWSCLSPGITLIRPMMARAVKAAAERQAGGRS